MFPFAQLRCLCVIWIRHIFQRPMKSFGKCKILLATFLSSSGWTVWATDWAILAIICNYMTHGNVFQSSYWSLILLVCPVKKIMNSCNFFNFYMCEKLKMWLCQIFSSFVSENWGRSNYKPDWQNQVTAAQYHVPNQFITNLLQIYYKFVTNLLPIYYQFINNLLPIDRIG